MSELIRDTVFSHLVRLVTKGRVLQYAEEKDPSLWKRYLDHDQTKNMAIYGKPEGTPEEKREKETSPAGNKNVSSSSEESSRTRSGDGEQQLHSTITGQKIDPEKGRDTSMVTWFGDNDPEVCVVASSSSSS